MGQHDAHTMFGKNRSTASKFETEDIQTRRKYTHIGSTVMWQLHCLPSSFSSSFRITHTSLFPIRINLDLWILLTLDRTPWTGDQPCRKASTYLYRTTQIQEKRGPTSMPRMRFQPTIPMFERAKTVHALGLTIIAIGTVSLKKRSTFIVPGASWWCSREPSTVTLLGSV